MKKILSTLLIVTMLFSLAACGNTSKPASTAPTASGAATASSSPAASEPAGKEATGEPVLFGVSVMDTGSQAASGIFMRKAVTMAVEEINANGGVLGGRPLEFIIDDNGTTPTGAVTVANKMLSQGIVASVGPHTSPMVASAMEYYKEEGIPFISAATSPALLEAENPYFFRISVSDGSVGQVMVKFAAEKFGAKKIASLFAADDYGIAADNASKAFAESNGIEYYSEGMNETDTDITSQLLKIKEWGPDVIFLFTHITDSALALRQINELGISENIPVVGPNALPMQQTLDLLDGSQVNGIYASTDFFADTSNPLIKDFLGRFAARWEGTVAERIASMYYSSTYLLADAIDRAGSDDPEAIRNALAETKGLETVVGNLNCSDKLELNSNVYILKFDEKKNSTVSQKVSLD